MTSKKPSLRRSRDVAEKSVDSTAPDLALAAIASFKKQKEVTDFMSYLLTALERNSEWLNDVVIKRNNFRCAFMTGAGPNRFQMQQIIYPCKVDDLKLEVELKDSEDHDKIAVAALLKLSNQHMDNLLQYIKTRLPDNMYLREELLKGKAMGVSFAVLRPLSEKQYRVVERIVLGSSMKSPSPIKKKRRDEKLFTNPLLKKTRQTALRDSLL